jgi:hypothetical protein
LDVFPNFRKSPPLLSLDPLPAKPDTIDDCLEHCPIHAFAVDATNPHFGIQRFSGLGPALAFPINIRVLGPSSLPAPALEGLAFERAVQVLGEGRG